MLCTLKQTRKGTVMNTLEHESKGTMLYTLEQKRKGTVMNTLEHESKEQCCTHWSKKVKEQ